MEAGETENPTPLPLGVRPRYPRTCRVRSVNCELAQVIALAAHGTSWLRRPSVPPPALDASNSTFQYVGGVDFHSIGPATADEGRSPSPVGRWLQLLHEAGVDRLLVDNPRGTDHVGWWAPG